MSLPFDGALSHYAQKKAPAAIRKQIKDAAKHEILDPSYPHPERLSKGDYEKRMDLLQHELVKLQTEVVEKGLRMVILFEGRDAAGKGGTISRMMENLNPRNAKVVALPKPTERELTQWYFQRYVSWLPAAGEIVVFDRSWYNRGVVEKVFGFCTDEQREQFFVQLPYFEAAIVRDGIILVKIWLEVSRPEQLRRMLGREQDPLKQWKLSMIDIEGLERWDDYSSAITETLARSDLPAAPWTVILSDDKNRARLAAIEAVLGSLDYEGRDEALLEARDRTITRRPEAMPTHVVSPNL